MDPVRLLLINATLQFFVSSVLGVLLLLPMQPWGKNLARFVASVPDMRATHLDWLMLGLMQFGIAFGLSYLPLPNALFIACLLVFGGWMNAFPYLVRGLFGINAFSLSGPPKQVVCALISLISVTALITAFGMALFGWFTFSSEEKGKKVWSGYSFLKETRVDAHPSPSLDTPGFDLERVWSGQDDWEPAIAADPASNYMYQLTTRFSGPRPCSTCPLPAIAFRRSSDSGATWSPDRFLPFSSKGQADPEIEVAGKGVLYAAWLEGYQVKFGKSVNRGNTWSPTVSITGNGRPGYGDKPIVAVSRNGQHVYIGFNSGDAFVAASHDFGKTFSPPLRISRTNHTWFSTGGAVALDGTVYFSITEFGAGYHGDANIRFLKSTDQGRTWTITLVDTSREVPECSSVPGCYFGFLGPSAAMAVDIAGIILIAYHANDVAGTPQRMFVRSSLDGIQWSPRRAVSVNQSGVNNAFPALAAGITAGDFRVAWQDDRKGFMNSWNTWLRKTTNGGATWSPAVRVSNGTSGAPYKKPAGFLFPYGDYFEMAVDASGRNHLIWGESLSYNGPGGTWYSRGQ